MSAYIWLMIMGCEDEVEVTGTYDPLTHIVTVTGRGNGESRERTIRISDLTLDENGCAVIEDEVCGTIKICGASDSTIDQLEIICSDPLLLQLPSGWTTAGGGWINDLDGTYGDILIEDAGDYRMPADVSVLTAADHDLVVVMADAVFEAGFEGTLEALFDTNGETGTGTELIAYEVMVARFLDSSGAEVSEPEIIVPWGSDDLDFTAGGEVSVTIEEASTGGDDTGGDDTGGDDTGTEASERCGCASASPVASGWFAFSVLGLSLWRRRRSGAGAS